ncbi:MAG: GFA family protein [Gammaproteobacteria bacterium]|nr:GFA family protein [Gammaproteobacteria bacterium]
MPHTFSGRCLCGAVQYTITGTTKTFYHCHCQRCRRATGTGHASNIAVKSSTDEKITWLQGEHLIKRYKVPEAERFTNSFCTQCGGRLPRYDTNMDVVIIPAGSLDNEPDMQPQARIFQDSRAAWSCDGKELPVFAEYPPSI